MPDDYFDRLADRVSSARTTQTTNQERRAERVADARAKVEEIAQLMKRYARSTKDAGLDATVSGSPDEAKFLLVFADGNFYPISVIVEDSPPTLRLQRPMINQDGVYDARLTDPLPPSQFSLSSFEAALREHIDEFVSIAEKDGRLA